MIKDVNSLIFDVREIKEMTGLELIVAHSKGKNEDDSRVPYIEAELKRRNKRGLQRIK